jgi:hypothetical protein
VVVEVWVWAVLMAVVGFAATEAVGLGRLVVEARRIGGKGLLRA